MRGFELVNASGDTEIDSNLAAFASDLSMQQVEIADWWQSQPLAVRLDSPDPASQSDWILSRIVQTLSDPEALAYHYLTASGRPAVDIGWGIIRANGGTIPKGLLEAISHEFCEARIDPYCDFMVDLPDASAEIPIETCDATQGDSYEVIPGTGRFVSNFLGPRWFGPAILTGPYDRMGLCVRPFELRPGGYLSKRVGGPSGSWDNVFGARMPEWMRKAKATGRTRRTHHHPWRGPRVVVAPIMVAP